MYGSPPVSLFDDDQLQVRALSVRARDLVYLRSLLEASEGLGFFIAKKGGDVLLVSPVSQKDELDRFILDLEKEIPIVERDLMDHREVLDVLE
jgi:hypothetical protein